MLQTTHLIKLNKHVHKAIRHIHDNGIVHLRVIRSDKQPIRRWYILQSIKNQLIGPEKVAFEVFPKESDLIDKAHVYHIWHVPDLVLPNLKDYLPNDNTNS